MDDNTKNTTNDDAVKPVAHDDKKPQEAKKEEPKQEEDYKAKYMRAIADYKNLMRTVEDERKELFGIATAAVVRDLLPTLDLMQQAEIWIKDVGLKMVMDQFAKTLEEMGVKEMPLLGKHYDPHTAEVVGTVESKEENKVVEVIKKAYEFNGKILRHGSVKVGRKQEEEKKEEKTETQS